MKGSALTECRLNKGRYRRLWLWPPKDIIADCLYDVLERHYRRYGDPASAWRCQLLANRIAGKVSGNAGHSVRCIFGDDVPHDSFYIPKENVKGCARFTHHSWPYLHAREMKYRMLEEYDRHEKMIEAQFIGYTAEKKRLSLINECPRCGAIGKKPFTSYKYFEEHRVNVDCRSCAQKIRWLNRHRKDAAEVNRLVNKLKKVITHENKRLTQKAN